VRVAGIIDFAVHRVRKPSDEERGFRKTATVTKNRTSDWPVEHG
jgi:hypothetical protein